MGRPRCWTRTRSTKATDSIPWKPIYRWFHQKSRVKASGMIFSLISSSKLKWIEPQEDYRLPGVTLRCSNLFGGSSKRLTEGAFQHGCACHSHTFSAASTPISEAFADGTKGVNYSNSSPLTYGLLTIISGMPVARQHRGLLLIKGMTAFPTGEKWNSLG